MKRNSVIFTNLVLLLWFSLDMIGVNLGNVYLVTRSWKEDGIFFLIFLIGFLLFIFKERVGKYVLPCWLGGWLLTQFFNHEWYTIVGGGEGKIEYFSGALHWIKSDIRYFPDVYHTVLHVLILLALITTVIYVIHNKSRN